MLSKKIIGSLTVIIFIFVISCWAVSAANPSIIVNVGEINDAKEFNATFVITDNPGFASFQVNVEFNPMFITPISIEQGHALYDGSMNTNLSAVLKDINSHSVTIYFVNSVNIVGDGELFKVRFKVSDTAVGMCTIKFVCQDGSFINQDFEELKIECAEGQITIDAPENEATPELTPTPEPTLEPTPSPTPIPTQPGSHASDSSDNTKYVVSYQTNGGTAIPDTEISEGMFLAMPPTPVRDGFVFDGWYLDAELKQKYDFSKVVTKSFTLYAKWLKSSQPSSTQFSKGTNPSKELESLYPSKWINPFNDVQTSDWYYDDVQYVVINGLFSGMSATTFEPDTAMSRAMFVTVLWRLSGNPVIERSPFSDVIDGAWYTNAVAWASANGIVNGIGNGMFAPDVEITREQMAAILYRYEQYSGKIPSYILSDRTFNDWDRISEYAKNPVDILVKQGLINGKQGNLFDPQGTATRAEVAAILHRYMESISKTIGNVP